MKKHKRTDKRIIGISIFADCLKLRFKVTDQHLNVFCEYLFKVASNINRFLLYSLITFNHVHLLLLKLYSSIISLQFQLLRLLALPLKRKIETRYCELIACAGLCSELRDRRRADFV